MFVKYKPWTFGNEWHNIACYDSGILFYVDLVEGKDAPTEPPPPGLFRHIEKRLFNVTPQKISMEWGRLLC